MFCTAQHSNWDFSNSIYIVKKIMIGAEYVAGEVELRSQPDQFFYCRQRESCKTRTMLINPWCLVMVADKPKPSVSSSLEANEREREMNRVGGDAGDGLM